MPKMILNNVLTNSKEEMNLFFKGYHTLDERRYIGFEKLLCGNNKKLLDVGCAEGYGIKYLFKYFPDFECTGYDISEVAIEKAKIIFPKGNFKVFDVLKEDLSGRYDYIIVSHILEHLNEPFDLVRKLIKYCGEKIIIAVPESYYPESGRHLWDIKEEDFIKEHIPVVKTDLKCLDNRKFKSAIFEISGSNCIVT